MLGVGDHQHDVGRVVSTNNCLIDTDLRLLIGAECCLAAGTELRVIQAVRDRVKVSGDARVQNLDDTLGGQRQTQRKAGVDRRR